MLFCEIKHVGEPATEAGSLCAGPGCGRLWGRRLPCQLDLLGRVHQAPQTQQVLLWSLPRGRATGEGAPAQRGVRLGATRGPSHRPGQGTRSEVPAPPGAEEAGRCERCVPASWLLSGFFHLAFADHLPHGLQHRDSHRGVCPCSTEGPALRSARGETALLSPWGLPRASVSPRVQMAGLSPPWPWQSAFTPHPFPISNPIAHAAVSHCDLLPFAHSWLNSSISKPSTIKCQRNSLRK